MKVGICYTKQSDHGEALCDAFAAGVRQAGDVPIPIRATGDLRQLKRCQVAVQVCIYNRWYSTRFRDTFRQEVEARARCRIVIDTGFIQNTSERSQVDGYMSVGFGGIKGSANYCNAGSPPDRWLALGESLRPWRTDGKHILVLGQAERGSSTQHMNDFVGWLTKAIQKLRTLTNRPIVLRPHPNQRRLPQLSLPGYRVSDKTLQEDLRGAWCCYARTTNASVRAVLQGIPLVTEDPVNVAYPVASHKRADVHRPATPDRRQWVYDLAYAQWTIAEMTAGLPWRHLRPHVEI